MRKILSWLKDEESGQGMVEYALIIGVIALVVIAAMKLLGPKIGDLVNDVAIPDNTEIPMTTTTS